MVYSVQSTQLFGILAHALQTVYCIDKSKISFGLAGSDWEQIIGTSFALCIQTAAKVSQSSCERVVSDLDSALNKWLDALPEHRKTQEAPPGYAV